MKYLKLRQLLPVLGCLGLWSCSSSEPKEKVHPPLPFEGLPLPRTEPLPDSEERLVSLESESPPAQEAPPQAPAPETPLRYIATSSSSAIRLGPSSSSTLLGQTMPRARLPVYEERLVENSGCKGPWLRVQYNGWTCSDRTREAPFGEEVESHFENRFPTQKAFLAREADVYDLPGGKVIGKKPSGTRVTVYRITQFQGKDYAQIENGVFVLADDVHQYQGRGSHNSPLRGALFDENTRFPVAFFLAQGDEGHLLFDAPGVTDPKKAIGHKIRYDRSEVLAQVDIDGQTYLRVEGGWLLATKDVVLVSPEPRPEGIAPDARWVLVDLSHQTVSAYEGDRLVFTTITASGKKSHKGYFWTVTGSYRLERKFRYKTMQGEPFGETYLVTDVPWPQFFHLGFAFHGAYWHNNFGRVTSHGCLNLTGADSKWMADFLEPQLPPGWMALFPPIDMDTSTIVVRNGYLYEAPEAQASLVLNEEAPGLQ